MRVWRVCREPFAQLDGKGAVFKGGRWNSPGLPVVYTSAHLSLALLEVLVHLEVDFEDLPDDYVSVEIDIEENLESEHLDKDIDIHNIRETRDFGDQWLVSAKSAALNVPSAVVPKESNICLNPQHPDFKAIRIVEIERFSFDPRLFELA